MNFKKLINKYINDNPGSTMNEYSARIIKLMGRYKVNGITKETMLSLLAKLDYMKYEIGYAVAKPKLIAIANEYQQAKQNLRKIFQFNSSTLYKALFGEKISIKFAISFCNKNNYIVKDTFNIYSIKKFLSIEAKENTKVRIRQLFDYAISHGYIKESPLPKKYRFQIDEFRKRAPLSKNILKDYVDALFNHHNVNGRVMALIYMIIKFDIGLMRKLTVGNFDFQNNKIVYENRVYRISKFVSDYLNDYFNFDSSNEKILKSTTSSYLRTIIYRIKNSIGADEINIESLTRNHSELMDIINSYADNGINNTNYQEMGLESKKDYNDFKEFLRLRELYEGGQA